MVFQAHPGDILAGKYRVDQVLGIGGMGMVVAATHLELDQQVALKFMLGELANSPNLLDRFLREARAVAKLRGEHVCRIFDVGRLDNGSPYIVMELLKGEDFAAVLSREGALAPTVAVTYLLQAIEGVAEAHAEGIVHRDLKPGNLFITTGRDGAPLVKVLDFGISKSQSAPATRTGDVLGSPGYMAPEQMSNAKATDARTDIWALGVILYQALSANMPWTGESLPALCMSVIGDPPPPLPDHVPAGLQAIVLRCLAKDREGRWPDVGELARELAKFGDGEAAQTATRISKIITTPTQPPMAATMPVLAGDGPELATIAARPPREITAKPIQPISTISASAAEIKVPPVEVIAPAKSKKPLLIAGAALAAGGIAIAVAVGGGGTSPDAPIATTRPTTPPVGVPEPPKNPPPPQESPVEVGQRTFKKKGCAACHTVDGSARIGPTFARAWGSSVKLTSGAVVSFDDNYFRESLMAPDAKVRVGFTPGTQPSFDGQLTEAEITGLIEYVKSLASAPVAAPDCTLPGKLDAGGTQAAEYKCSKIDFKTKACQCATGYAMRTPDNVAICHVVPDGCPAPVAEPVASSRPTTPPRPKPPDKPPADKKPDDMWMQMTHDKDKAKNPK